MEMQIMTNDGVVTEEQWDKRLSRIAADAARVADELYEKLVNERDWDGTAAADLVGTAMPAIVKAVS